MTENHGDETEGVTLPLVDVGAADARALDLDQDVVILQFGDGEFADLHFLRAGQHRDLRGLGNGGGGTGSGAGHFTKHASDDAFQLSIAEFHECFVSFRQIK